MVWTAASSCNVRGVWAEQEEARLGSERRSTVRW
ncbi:hypothetical protein ACP4OV_027293 [Aristida adscensionis]